MDSRSRSRFLSHSLILQITHFLLLITCSCGDDDEVLKLHSMDGTHDHDMVTHGHDHTSHMDPLSRSFFLIENLKTDHEFYTCIPENEMSESARFLPRREAESIPFSLKDLADLLVRFNFAEGSAQARAMRATLSECQARPISNETKFCATSLESMLDFVRSTFGPTLPRFGAITTTRSGSRSRSRSTVRLQSYRVVGTPVEVAAPRMVGCHTASYPYLVFYCHSSVTEVRVFQVALVGEDGDDVDAVAVCHMDTSEWSPGHVAFRVLGIERGTSPVCHFFPVGHLVWVPKLS